MRIARRPVARRRAVIRSAPPVDAIGAALKAAWIIAIISVRTGPA
jgi:hypothetical protein